MALRFLNSGYFAGKVGIGIEIPLELLHLEATEPLIRFDDTNSGLHYIVGQDGDGFKFTTNNSTYGKYTFDSNVGIGTASPLSIVSTSGLSTVVYDASSVNGQDSTSTIKIANRSTNANTFASIDFNTNNNRVTNRIVSSHAGTVHTGFLAFVTESYDGTSGVPSEKMRITGTGNVGIGTTSPDAKLQINATTSGDVYLSGGSADLRYLNFSTYNTSSDHAGHKIDATSSNGEFAFAIGGSAKMYIKSDGLIGIGTSGPQSKLQVAGGIQMADDTATASATKVGTMRYRTATNEPVPVTGTELVANSDFSDGSTGWTVNNPDANNYVTFSGGTARLVFLTTSPITQLRSTNTTLISGTKYRLVVDIASVTSGSVKIDGAGISETFAQAGVTTRIIQPTNNTPLYFYRASANVDMTFNSVSVIEVTEEDASYADMCMQTGTSTYEWVNIVRNTY